VFAQIIRGKVTDPNAVRPVVDRWVKELGPTAKGWLGSTSGIADDNEVFVLVRFESEESVVPQSVTAVQFRAGRGLGRDGLTVFHLPRERQMAPTAARGAQRHPRRQCRRLRLVARRHDPQRRPRPEPTRVGKRHVHPGRALVPTEREIRRFRPRSLPHRIQPQRLPRRELRTPVGQPLLETDLNDTGRRGPGIN